MFSDAAVNAKTQVSRVGLAYWYSARSASAVDIDTRVLHHNCFTRLYAFLFVFLALLSYLSAGIFALVPANISPNIPAFLLAKIYAFPLVFLISFCALFDFDQESDAEVRRAALNDW